MALETCEFGPIVVRFDHSVLRPRPWTLVQAEWAVELSPATPAGPMLELCAGAGQIGLVAALGCGRRLVQVDASADACRFARQNAAAAGLADRVEVRHAEIGSAVAADERFAIVIADPPYLPSDDVANFPEDPVHAIDGGLDGLDVTAACLAVAARHLLPGGEVLMQVRGAEQAKALAGLCPEVSVGAVEVRAVDRERAVARISMKAQETGAVHREPHRRRELLG